MILTGLKRWINAWWTSHRAARALFLAGPLVAFGCGQTPELRNEVGLRSLPRSTAGATLPPLSPRGNKSPLLQVSQTSPAGLPSPQAMPAADISRSVETNSNPTVQTANKPAHATEKKPEMPKTQITDVKSLPDPKSAKPKAVPMNLWTVLQLAEGQNGKLSVEKERLYESQIVRELSRYSWIPAINVGTTYYRHEGGSQDETGKLIRASSGAMFLGLDVGAQLDLRNTIQQQLSADAGVWQQQGEITRLTSQTLIEAANAYFDLLLAHNAEAVVLKMQEDERFVLNWAKDRAESEKQAKYLVDAAVVQASARQRMLMKIRQQMRAASLKLAGILGLPADAQIYPVDHRLVPVELVDAQQTPSHLIAKALQSGPGVHELEMILSLIQKGIAESESKRAYLPVLEMRLLEGGFAAGTDSNLTTVNRFDLILGARWNLTQLFTADSQRRVAYSKLQQAHLKYADLKHTLSLGVTEAHDSVHRSSDLIRYGIEQIQYAKELHKGAKLRLMELDGNLTNEVLQAIKAMEMAQLGWLETVLAHNKAQVRLLVLTGHLLRGGTEKPCEEPTPAKPAPAKPAPAKPAPAKSAPPVRLPPPGH